MRLSRILVGVLALAGTLVSAGPAAAHGGDGRADVDESGFIRPVLEKRATLSADYIAPGPPSGALATPANGRSGPFPGQVIPGFSGIGVCKDVLIPRDASGNLASPTPVLADAHKSGLIVHGWTFRLENTFLPANRRSSTVPNKPGDLPAEIRTFVAAGMDGFFADNPIVGSAAVAAIAATSGNHH
jgi:hypothetical protein